MNRTLPAFLCYVCCLATAACSGVAVRQDEDPGDLYLEVSVHYGEDSVKREAAQWLIDGMRWHHTLDGPLLDRYLGYYHLYSERGNGILPLIDSLVRSDGYSKSTLQLVSDLSAISAPYLVHNIDRSFWTRDSLPWCRPTGWDDFVRYVLPYRIKDEKPTMWRDSVLAMYSPVIDSLRRSGCNSPLAAARAIMAAWNSKEFKWTGRLPEGPAIGLANVRDKGGSCLEFAHGVVYLMRAAGIPSGIDMVPARGENNSSHFWPFIKDADGKTYVTCTENTTFVPADSFDIRAPKIYRLEYAADSAILERLPVGIDYPMYLSPPCISDVTSVYKPEGCHTLSLEVADDVCAPVYLAVSSNDRWIPVAMSVTDSAGVFDDVCGGVVGCIGTWDGKSLTPVGYPFEIDAATGKTREIKGGDETAKISIYSKFPVDERNGDLVYRIVGGRIEGARHADFRDAVTLFTVTEMPKRRMTVAYPSGGCGAFRYYRYVGPPDGYCNIAEVSLYGNTGDTVPLRGHVFGTPGSWDDDPVHTFEKVFDGNPDTSFDYKEADGGWSAIDLGRPVEVRKIMYVPRNRDNYVRGGDVYELFWYGEGKWNSLGKQQAFGDSLSYDVPRGALLYLRNHSRGKDERIFEYDFEKREQKFW